MTEFKNGDRVKYPNSTNIGVFIGNEPSDERWAWVKYSNACLQYCRKDNLELVPDTPLQIFESAYKNKYGYLPSEVLGGVFLKALDIIMYEPNRE